MTNILANTFTELSLNSNQTPYNSNIPYLYAVRGVELFSQKAFDDYVLKIKDFSLALEKVLSELSKLMKTGLKVTLTTDQHREYNYFYDENDPEGVRHKYAWKDWVIEGKKTISMIDMDVFESEDVFNALNLNAQISEKDKETCLQNLCMILKVAELIEDSEDLYSRTPLPDCMFSVTTHSTKTSSVKSSIKIAAPIVQMVEVTF